MDLQKYVVAVMWYVPVVIDSKAELQLHEPTEISIWFM